MNQFTKRLLVFATVLVAFSVFAVTLSQAVSYKPWGVPDSRRDEYDARLAEMDRQDEIRQSETPRSRVKAWPTLHNFGLTQSGESVSHSFRIDNAGDAELTLEIRGTSSDRIQATLDRTTVPPGDAAYCEVTLECLGESTGLIDKQSVTLLTNDPLNQTTVLSTQYTLARELVLPDRIDFGSHDIANPSSVEFVVYSQTGENLELVDASADNFDIQWGAADTNSNDGQLSNKSATGSQRIHLEIKAKDYGTYSGEVELTVKIDGEPTKRKVPFSGRVRPPIGFYGPSIDQRSGVNFGTVENDQQHDLFVVVRSRADKSRPIKVLGVEPKELQTELTPLKTPGSYRLRVSIPKDCPYLRFNLATQHGYVHIGDPNSNEYSGTLPVYGVVGDFRED